MQDELSQLFAFEDDFAGSLRCVPMAVRFKLDEVGVKIALRDWARLHEDERAELLRAPFADSAARAVFRARVRELVRLRSGADPADLSIPDAAPWAILAPVPLELRSASAPALARAVGRARARSRG